MESTRDGRNSIGVVLVAHPELAAKGPEGARHYSWIFDLVGTDEDPDIGGISGPVHFPHLAAKFARHEHVVPKCALLVEGNPRMVRRAACVRDGRKQCGRIG